MIIGMPIPSYVGEWAPLANVGDMKNSGLELEVSYKGRVGDFNYAIKGNATYLKNTLNNLGNDSGFINYGINQFAGGGLRAQNGEEFPYFYGLKTDGVFQTMEEVNAYTHNGQPIMPGAKPGDVRFKDINGDGQITDDDRTKIGSGVPDWTFGINASAEWKGFDFNMFWQGVAGNNVFDATYRQDVASGNFPTWILSRWTGEGTSNRVPKITQGDKTINWNVSDLYVFDGSYFRLKNITLGYTLPRAITQKARIDRLRVYATAENLFTFTKYHGFDPEIGTSVYSLGVDYGVYPQARTFSIGFNISL